MNRTYSGVRGALRQLTTGGAVYSIRCWPSFLPLVYISNIKYFVTLKSCLPILFLSQGTNAVWGFNFLREGVLKPFKLLKCILVGGRKGKLFCNFWFVRGFRANCKCACLCVVAWYSLRNLCFVKPECLRNTRNCLGIWLAQLRTCLDAFSTYLVLLWNCLL